MHKLWNSESEWNNNRKVFSKFEESGLMRILVACEESQAVTKEFRKLGHEAYSCDVLDCSGGHPEWHIKGDVLPLLKQKWDMIIAHPPCTYLSTAATRAHSLKSKENTLESIADRTMKRIKAMEFFMEFINADCDKIAVENPTGVMNTCYRQPDCTVHPWYFAEDENDKINYQQKRTSFWLKGLKPLEYDLDRIEKPVFEKYESNGKPRNFMNVIKCPTTRSKTFPSIAKAMAEQWGGLNENKR